MLWLGLHLPALSLESFTAVLGPAAVQPVALVERHRIVAVNAAAQALGVSPGMKRATALALAPTLLLAAADAARDAQALLAVAHTLLAFTPTVVVVPPDGVLAELQASLRCFGGLEALWRRMHDALTPLGHTLRMAHAPGALGALLLARWRPDPAPPQAVTSLALADVAADPLWADLQRRLALLPAAALVEDPRAHEVLRAMGLVTLADLRRQPRAGLTRRLGPALLDALDRAHGLSPDPREPIAPPWRFADQVELHARTAHTDALLAGAAVLLARLAAWARARHARVGRLVLTLHHETRLRASSLGEAGAHVSTLVVALAEPSADPAHWQAVLRERLAREPLAAPVLSLSLACDEPVLGPPPDVDLFPAAAQAREGLLRLLERLQARLGTDGVQRLAPWPDHRPEQATRIQNALQATAKSPTRVASGSVRLSRPAWLLPVPQAMHERQSRPWLDDQPLRLVGGPERIEAGWWDGVPAARDYFIAQAPTGELLWIYRLRPAPATGQPGWFLHGRFG